MQAQILNLMKDLQREFGLTYLFISHNLAVFSHISNRVGVMYLGRVVEIADTKKIFQRPLHPYTQMLQSAIPDLKMTGKQRTPVAGEVPNPLTPPPGCTFTALPVRVRALQGRAPVADRSSRWRSGRVSRGARQTHPDSARRVVRIQK